MSNKILLFLCCQLLVFNTFSQIVENIEVKGKIYSREMNSKNMVIIEEGDLNSLNIKDFAELFSFFSLVNVSRRGPSESSFDISMRGGNFEQILVLVNGVPLNNPQTGHFNTDLPFLIEDIKRIEIVRGGCSTAYGSGAFTGVINIVLKKESLIDFSVTSGENNYFSSNINLGKKIKNLAFKFSFNRSNSSGYYKGREFEQTKLTGGTFFSEKGIDVGFFTGFLSKDFGAEGFYAPFPSFEKIDSFFYLLRMNKTVKKFNYSVTYSFNSHDDEFILDSS